MRIYIVGGSVRDRLLNIPPRDTDYLVVEASDGDMLAKGLVKVGQTFPIFLNPENGDEYTLGKSVDEDLSRRDLTINAMAIDENNQLIDLYGGEDDLKKKILRHVSRENFFEDPLRVLRVARFMAQLPDFSIHPETLKLMLEVVVTPAFAKILPERMVKELKRVFECEKPSQFFEVLKSVGAMSPHFQEIKSYENLDRMKGDEELSFSSIVTGMSLTDLEQMTKRLNIQTNWIETAESWILFSRLDLSHPEKVLDFFYEADTFRKPRMIEHVVKLDPVRGKDLQRLYHLVKDIGIADVDPQRKGKEIGEEIRRLRLKRLG
ncbi:MAG: hypothetical protein V4598_05235 [Bdellovibrionota bacterium]